MPKDKKEKKKRGQLSRDFKKSKKMAAKRAAEKAKRQVNKTVISACAGSSAHKAQRWKDYKGDWKYERWSNTYEANMVKARNANVAVDAYHEELGWGEREVSIEIGGVTRRLDIADEEEKKGVEHKTGYICLSEDIKWEVERDAELVKDDWDIAWRFDGTASQPLLDALAKAGIPYSFKS